jgi:hypothetical protein
MVPNATTTLRVSRRVHLEILRRAQDIYERTGVLPTADEVIALVLKMPRLPRPKIERRNAA